MVFSIRDPRRLPWCLNGGANLSIRSSRMENYMMRLPGTKQPTLKPQDLFVVLKIAVSGEATPSFAQLSREMSMSASEAHAAVQRSITSHLLSREGSCVVVNRASLREFIIHGVRYAFPGVSGPVTRGMPTGASAPPLQQHFGQSNNLPQVWPDAEGHVRGVSFCPLYPSVPAACRQDDRLYRALVLVDALRGGAAREREFAMNALTAALN